MLADGRKKVRPPKSSAVDELLEGVSDPVLRARINLLIADLESTRAQLLAARHLASKNSVLVLSGPEALATAPAQPDAALTPQEKKSFAAAISEKTLEHWGWLIDSNGRVLTNRGQVVFGAGFVTTIYSQRTASGRILNEQVYILVARDRARQTLDFVPSKGPVTAQQLHEHLFPRLAPHVQNVNTYYSRLRDDCAWFSC